MDGVKRVHEENRRSALKTVSWRIIATSTTMLLVFFFTGQLELAAGVGVGDVVLKMIFYFLHERAWNKVKFGRTFSGAIESAMRTPPVTALPSDTVPNIVLKMVTSDIGAVIVVDSEKEYGLITERDILEKVVLQGRNPAETCAKEIMSSPLKTVEFSRRLTAVLKIMREEQVRRLATTKNGKVVGIVTERRLLAALI